MQRGAEVKDWSWAQTARRVSTLARLAAPYRRADDARRRLARSPRPLTALAPPFLAKLAVDDGISEGDLDALDVIVALFVVAGLANLARQHGADVLHRLDGRADPRRPPQPALPPPPAALARLLRAEPRRRRHQPADERRRGARPARHRRRHHPRPEHAHARRHGGHPLLPRLAARARHARRLPADGVATSVLPRPLGARLPRACASASGSSPRRSPRTSPACASSSRSRASGRTTRQFRDVNDALPRREPGDGGAERALLPVRRLPLAVATAIVLGYGG